jgi:inner membrane transporter RhtA
MKTIAGLHAGPAPGITGRLPPHAYFLVSALFHYLGPAFAVLLFSRIDSLGVAWLRIASAALIFAVWRRPWRVLFAASKRERWLLLALGAVLGLMNSVFYLAIERLPLATVGAIEFVGPILLAAAGVRSARNFGALALAVAGVALLTDVQWAGEPLGLLFAFANCALFILYIVLGHKISGHGDEKNDNNSKGANGIDRLAAAMLIAFIVASPLGAAQALPAFNSLTLLGAAIGVGICSSVIPYVCDQLAMARLPRATFALLLALLPAVALVVGVVVLGQVPGAGEMLGVGLVVLGVALHKAA